MKRFKLSNSEEILMDTLWRENRPLTTLQLAEKVTEARWNTNYIDKLLQKSADIKENRVICILFLFFVLQRSFVLIDHFFQLGNQLFFLLGFV